MPSNLHVPAAAIKQVLLDKLLPLETALHFLNNPSNLLHSALMESLANKSSLKCVCVGGVGEGGILLMHPSHLVFSFSCSLNYNLTI